MEELKTSNLAFDFGWDAMSQALPSLQLIQLIGMFVVFTDTDIKIHSLSLYMNVIDGCTLGQFIMSLFTVCVCVCVGVPLCRWSFWHLFRIHSIILFECTSLCQFICNTRRNHRMIWCCDHCALPATYRIHTRTALASIWNWMSQYMFIRMSSVHERSRRPWWAAILLATGSCIISSESLSRIYLRSLLKCV